MEREKFVQSKKPLKGFERDLDSSPRCLHHIVLVPTIKHSVNQLSVCQRTQRRCSPVLLGISLGSSLLFRVRKDASTWRCVGRVFAGTPLLLIAIFGVGLLKLPLLNEIQSSVRRSWKHRANGVILERLLVVEVAHMAGIRSVPGSWLDINRQQRRDTQ